MTSPTPNAMPGAQQAAAGGQQAAQAQPATTPPAAPPAGAQSTPPAGQPAGQPASPAPAGSAPWESSGEPFDPARAWNTIQQQRTENATLKSKLQEAQPVLDEHERLRQASQSELDRAREELTNTSSARDTWRAQAVQSKAEALAAGRFAYTDVALQMLGDLSSYATDNGIDTARLTASLDELAQKYPNLLAQTNPHGMHPDRAQGQSGTGGGAAATLDAQIKAAEDRGDVMTSIALKQQKLYASQNK